MDPVAAAQARCGRRLPRTRGDGPLDNFTVTTYDEASPHTRGWTLVGDDAAMGRRGFPAHAGMDPLRLVHPTSLPRLPRTRGDGPSGAAQDPARAGASPHTRGWTPAVPIEQQPVQGFPAHAGMDPATSSGSGSGSGLPRTRGDGPPACQPPEVKAVASPHTRGWTRLVIQHHVSIQGFPAHAGMDPRPCRPARYARRLPRTRGDGPLA